MVFTDEQKANALLWIEALESGQYQQITNQLRLFAAPVRHGNAGYCCLGVACDVFHNVTGGGQWRDPEKGREGGFEIRPGVVVSDVMPTMVSKWLGLTSDPTLDFTGLLTESQEDALRKMGLQDYKEHVKTSCANDKLGVSFKTIARALRRRFGFADTAVPPLWTLP